MPGCYVCEKEQEVLRSKTVTVVTTVMEKGKPVEKKDTGSKALCDDCFPHDTLTK